MCGQQERPDMKLTSFTDYSLRVLIYLSAAGDRKATIAEIASAFDVSENHLIKVVHFLGKQGWVATTRGKGGGLALGKPARSISIGQVVRDTEKGAAPAECFEPSGGHCAIAKCCELKHALAEAVQAFYAVLDRYTLADVAGNPQAIAKVLNFYPARPVAGAPRI